MKRLEILIDEVRRSTDSVVMSTSGPAGISELQLVQFFNDAQDHLENSISNEHPNCFLAQGFIDIVANQEQYTLPSDIYMGSKVKTIEYLYGSTNQYYRLYPVNFFYRDTRYNSVRPYNYILSETGTIRVNPIPSISVTNGLRIIYQRWLKDIDIRRGVISSASITTGTINSFTLNASPSLPKDDGTLTGAADLLNRADHICVVDSFGATIQAGIPIDSYNSSTKVLTVSSLTGNTTTLSAGSFAGKYIVAGKNTTTHSELPDLCERYLVAYVSQKVYRRNGNVVEADRQSSELSKREKEILDAYKYPSMDIPLIPDDWDWNYGF